MPLATVIRNAYKHYTEEVIISIKKHMLLFIIICRERGRERESWGAMFSMTGGKGIGKRGKEGGGEEVKVQIREENSNFVHEWARKELLERNFGSEYRMLITLSTLLSPSLSQSLFFWYLSWSIWTVPFSIELAVPS